MKTLTENKPSASNLLELLVAAYGREMAELLFSVHGVTENGPHEDRPDDHTHDSHRHAA